MMRLTNEEIETVAGACEACELAPGQITSLAGRLLPDAEGLVWEYQTDDRSRHAIAKALLNALNAEDKAYEFVRALFAKVDWSREFRVVVGPVLGDVRGRAPEHEAFLYAKDNVIAESEFREVMDQTGRKICCLVAEYNGGRIFGTGFLIGPDHILTAMHVFEKLIKRHGEAEVSRRFRAVFDYEIGELTPDRLSNNDGGLRVVRFAKDDWLLAKSPRFEFEGLLSEIDDDRLDLARNSLDFAVVKLAEPIGRERLDRHGTQSRGWFSMGDTLQTDYDPDSQVAIWQHPFGRRRHFAFGRIERTLNCGQRIIVKEASTGAGASGGPCLRLDSGVVGVHVAAYSPNVEPEGTQAIRFDRIRDAVAPYFSNEAGPGRVRPWRVDDPDGSLLPIIGRDTLITWLMNALKSPPGTLHRNERVYSGLPKSEDDDTGLSFSVEILSTMISGEADNPLVMFGADTILPASPEDLAIAIGTELGIPEAALRRPPERPSASLPTESLDGDKLDRWSSNTMPRWFLDLAAETCKSQGSAGRWERAWIALDELNQRQIPPLVNNFIAGLIGADIDEVAVPDAARRIHWLFLGHRPHFLKLEDVSFELVDGSTVGKEDLRKALEAVCLERNLADVNLEAKVDKMHALIEALAATGAGSQATIAQQLLASEIKSLLSEREDL